MTFNVYFSIAPGIHKPRHKLGEYMVRAAENTFNEVDLVLFLIEPAEQPHPLDLYVIERLKNVKTPVILVINKIDTIEREKLLAVIDTYSKLYGLRKSCRFPP